MLRAICACRLERFRNRSTALIAYDHIYILYLMSYMGEISEIRNNWLLLQRVRVESKILAHGTLAGLDWPS